MAQLEAQAHQTGWDGPGCEPALFTIAAQTEGRDLAAHPELGMTFVLAIATRTDGLGPGIQIVAEYFEHLRRHDFRDGAAPANAVVTLSAPDQDLHQDFPQGSRFWGYALRAVTSVDNPGTDPDGVHAGLVDARVVYLVTRDGTVWLCQRRRGDKPLITANPQTSSHPNVDGTIVSALRRITIAIAATA